MKKIVLERYDWIDGTEICIFQKKYEVNNAVWEIVEYLLKKEDEKKKKESERLKAIEATWEKAQSKSVVDEKMKKIQDKLDKL